MGLRLGILVLSDMGKKDEVKEAGNDDSDDHDDQQDQKLRERTAWQHELLMDIAEALDVDRIDGMLVEAIRALQGATEPLNELVRQTANTLACEPGDIITRTTELTDGWFLRQELLEDIAEALDSDVIDASLEKAIWDLRGTEKSLREKLKSREEALENARDDLSAVATVLQVEAAREAILDGIQSLKAKALETDARDKMIAAIAQAATSLTQGARTPS